MKDLETSGIAFTVKASYDEVEPTSEEEEDREPDKPRDWANWWKTYYPPTDKGHKAVATETPKDKAVATETPPPWDIECIICLKADAIDIDPRTLCAYDLTDPEIVTKPEARPLTKPEARPLLRPKAKAAKDGGEGRKMTVAKAEAIKRKATAVTALASQAEAAMKLHPTR